MNNLLLIAIGGAVGSVLRYLLSTTVYRLLGTGFPYGTLTVNIIGSFFMGLIAMLCIERFSEISTTLRALLMIGVLGGFTTFSAFSFETFSLFEDGKVILGISNIMVSVVCCMIAVWLGVLLGRQC